MIFKVLKFFAFDVRWCGFAVTFDLYRNYGAITFDWPQSVDVFVKLLKHDTLPYVDLTMLDKNISVNDVIKQLIQ